MRHGLDRLYALSGALAAISLLVLLLVVLVQVVFNVIDKVLAITVGEPIGLLIPSYTTFAGYFLVAASFFALAYTLAGGGHIRVTLTLHALRPRWRLVFEIWATAAASALSLFFAWHAVLLTSQSWRFGDTATGLVPIPIWMPQAVMACGVIVLTIACLDSLVQNLLGREPAYLAAERAVDAQLTHPE